MRSWVNIAKQSLQEHQELAHRTGKKFKYAVNEERLNDREIWQKFRLLKFDSEAESFVRSCLEEYLTCKQVCLTTIANLLQRFLSMGFTNANGLLNRGSMHVFSTAQFEFLLKEAKRACGLPDTIGSNGSPGNYVLLDVGAGDGMVTKKMEPFFDTVYCTEVSTFMANRLTERGYRCIQTGDLSAQALSGWNRTSFDVISFLNVLDRCDKPLTLLRQMKALLKPDGFLVIAVVLPFEAFVESGKEQKEPAEFLDPVMRLPGTDLDDYPRFEDSVRLLVRNVLDKAGLEVVVFGRIPYLSRGDTKAPYYWLSDVLMVLKHKQE